MKNDQWTEVLLFHVNTYKSSYEKNENADTSNNNE